MKIANKELGNDGGCFIIAELSANHLHDLSIALSLVKEAAKAGADAFKIQTLTPDTMTINCSNKYFKINNGTAWDNRTLYDLYSETPLPYEWHEAIFQECKKHELVCFSTPYDLTSLRFLDQFSPEAYKIASFEIFDLELIKETAQTGKPIILSTGVAEIDDIHNAVKTCRLAGNDNIILLKCTSAYPTPFDEVNLKTMKNMADTFETLVGISDHTLGDEVAIASIALGGCVIEKHLTLDRQLGGPDAGFSMEPYEFSEMVRKVRNTEKLLGKIQYSLTEKAKKSLIFSRSLFFVADIREGETITKEHVRSIRPGYGLKPIFLSNIIGRKAAKNILRGTPCLWDLVE